MKKCTIDLTGKKFDCLQVLKWHSKGGDKSNTEWECKCDCGATCVKSRSYLRTKTKIEKDCGVCIKGNVIIGRTFQTFKILQIIYPQKRKLTASGFYVGECNRCGHKKSISKMMIKNSHKPYQKRNLTCPSCLIVSRRGAGLQIGDQNGFLRIFKEVGARGEGANKKYYWKVECLFNGPKCKKAFACSTADFGIRTSCGCKSRAAKSTINGMSKQSHPHHKIYLLRKNCYDKCHKPEHPSYKNYGARGICVCDQWKHAPGEEGRKRLMVFLQWCLDNGWQEGLHLDRIDNDGPYAPDNCQFILPIENLFYASLDSCDEQSLKKYQRYHQLWSLALKVLSDAGEEIEQDFKELLERWETRLSLRTMKLMPRN